MLMNDLKMVLVRRHCDDFNTCLGKSPLFSRQTLMGIRLCNDEQMVVKKKRKIKTFTKGLEKYSSRATWTLATAHSIKKMSKSLGLCSFEHGSEVDEGARCNCKKDKQNVTRLCIKNIHCTNRYVMNYSLKEKVKCKLCINYKHAS